MDWQNRRAGYRQQTQPQRGLTMAKLLKPGQAVAFSSKWLKATQAHDLGRDRGQVVEVASSGGLVLVAVRWADGRVTRALHQNLVAVDRMHLEAV